MNMVYKYRYVHANTLEAAAPSVFIFCLPACYLTSNCIWRYCKQWKTIRV